MAVSGEVAAAVPRVKLRTGVKMPLLGFGTFRLAPGEETRTAVGEALKNGYRLIDTAEAYENEREVGNAIAESGVPREEMFVTSKVWNDRHGYEPAARAFEESLHRLGISYMDLYLIHWPTGGRIVETWTALVDCVKEGRCRNAGVSNFGIDELRMIEENCEELPAVNQVECNLQVYPRELHSYCLERGIQLQAYTPLAKGRMFDNETVRTAAHRYAKKPAQIMLRWLLQHEIVSIPKAAHREHLRENMDIFDFELSDEDMQILDSLST